MKYYLNKMVGLKGGFLASVGTLVFATAIGQVLVLSITPLLTRLYTPSDFGVMAVFVAITSMILVVSSGRYEFSIPLPVLERDARLLLFGSLLINFVFFLTCFLIVALFSSGISTLVGVDSFSSFAWLIPLTVLFSGAYKAYNYLSVRQQNYQRIAKTKVIQSFSSVVVQVFGGLISQGPSGLLIGQMLGQAAGTFQLAKSTSVYDYAISKVRYLRLLLLLKRYRRFPLYDAPAAFIDTLSTQLPNLVLATLFGPVVAGSYMLAERALSMPANLVGQAFGQVLFGTVNAQKSEGKFYSTTLRAVMLLGGLAVFPTIIFFFYASPIFSVVFGDTWTLAGDYASWMIVGVAFQFVYSPLSMTLLATDGQKVNLMIHVVMLTSKMGVLAVGNSLGDPYITIVGFSIVSAVGYFIAIFVVLNHVAKNAHVLKRS
ncbi:lipopolysaccharide biosynthesis protein [Pseudomonas azotoformans]|uniref:lipopolysaccharide biosynthesis protein n=1 Tax=Pseudomonas azotoformans TaxID=47878 RepID=UPI0012E8C513|nr:oligosaccharide flippase family protein [Pseudomonas azotoformans]